MGTAPQVSPGQYGSPSPAIEFADEQRQEFAGGLSKGQKRDIGEAVGSGIIFGGIEAAKPVEPSDAIKELNSSDLPSYVKSMKRPFLEGGVGRRSARLGLGAAAATYGAARATNSFLSEEEIYENSSSETSSPEPPSFSEESFQKSSSVGRISKYAKGLGAFSDAAQKAKKTFESPSDIEMPEFEDVVGDLSPGAGVDEVESAFRNSRLESAGEMLDRDTGFQMRESLRGAGESISGSLESAKDTLKTDAKTLTGIGLTGLGAGAANYGYRATQPDVQLSPQERQEQRRVETAAQNVGHPAGPLAPESQRMHPNQPRVSPNVRPRGQMQKQSSRQEIPAGTAGNAAFLKEGARALKDLDTEEENGTTKAKYRGRWMPVDKPVESWRNGKKRAVLASKEVGGEKRVKLVHYGSSDHDHNYSEKAKQNYLARARGITDGDGNPTKDDPHSANHWSIKDLWPEENDPDGGAKLDLEEITKTSAEGDAPAPSSPSEDFLAGIDPFGTWTTPQAMQNARSGMSEQEHRKRQALNFTGGLIGGGLAVPSVTSGTVSAASEMSNASSAREALAKGGLGFLRGAAQPVQSVARGTRLSKSLDEAAQSGDDFVQLSGKSLDDLSAGLQNSNLGSLADATGGSSSGLADDLSDAYEGAKNPGWFGQNVPRLSDIGDESVDVGQFADDAQRLRNSGEIRPEFASQLSDQIRKGRNKGLGQLGFGAGVGGVGASVQYQQGKEIGEEMSSENGNFSPEDKTASITADLREHQRRIRNRVQSQDGLVAAHDMGSGKTLSAISALEDTRQENPDSMLRVLTPASLRENFQKEVQKHTDGGITGGTPQPKSHTKATMEGPQDEKADMRVVDEAHRARSTGSKFKKRLRETPAEQNLLMTGTPVYNHPHEISPLVNISAGENLLPETKSRFETKYVSEEEKYPGGLSGLAYRITGGSPGIQKKLDKGKESLRKPLREYVDYYEPDRDNENYPDVEEEEVKVEMSDKQKKSYKYMFKDLPMHLRWKVQSNLPPDKDERGKMMKFLNGPRQVATSVNAFDEDMSTLEAGQDSPKIQEVAEAVDDSSKRQVVYSNFLESGLDPLRAVLDEKGVNYGEYTGSTSQSRREEDVRRFNEGEISTLVMSSAGGEGLDLDAVNEIHVMEPHWNEQKINQVVARADRYKSHENLPEEEREVKVKRYISELPEKSVSNAIRSVFGGEQSMTGSVEEYIQGLAKEKQELSDQLIDVLKEETENVKESSVKEADPTTQYDRKASEALGGEGFREGAAGLTGAGATLAAGANTVPSIPSSAIEKADEFESKTLNANNPADFAASYINRGSDLMGSDVVDTVRGSATAKDTIKALRTSDTVEAVFGDTGDYNKAHYESFESGPRGALSVLGRETAVGEGATDNIPKPDNSGRFLGIDFSGLNPFGASEPAEPREFKRPIREAHAQEGLSTYLDNELQQVAEENDLNLDNRPEAEQAVRQTLQQDDPVINNFNRKMSDYWGDAPQHYKNQLFDNLRSYEGARRNVGRLGLTAGALGVAGYGASKAYKNGTLPVGSDDSIPKTSDAKDKASGEKTAAPDTIMSAVSAIRDQVYGDLDLDKDELRDLAHRAEKQRPNRERLENLFGEKVRLHGSQGLGINVPEEDSDIDVTIPTGSEEEYRNKIEEVKGQFSDLESSPYNRFRDGVYVMSGTVDDEDMDVVVGHGDHVDKRVKRFEEAKQELSPEDRGRIIGEKKRLKNALILSKPRYNQYKREVDNELDIPRL